MNKLLIIDELQKFNEKYVTNHIIIYLLFYNLFVKRLPFAYSSSLLFFLQILIYYDGHFSDSFCIASSVSYKLIFGALNVLSC
jgi:hypothetical protein